MKLKSSPSFPSFPSFIEELDFLPIRRGSGSSSLGSLKSGDTQDCKFLPILGIDEAGRGCLAGPVVVAAVAFSHQDFAAWNEVQSSKGRAMDLWFCDVNDSKLLSARKRKELSQLIHKYCAVQIAWALPEVIDERNILWACFDAMREAVWPFSGLASTLLVDGHLDPLSPRYGAPEGFARRVGVQRVKTLVKGDSRSFSIAAASIVAKVFRDEWMHELHEDFQHYAWDRNKGYPTKEHRESLKTHGISPWHRRSFDLNPG